MFSRRQLTRSLLFCAGLASPLGRALAQSTDSAATTLRAHARQRIILDNDFSGDPDGLFQLAHLLLSPSVDMRLVIGSHLAVKDPFDPTTTQSENAAATARELLGFLHLGTQPPVVAGRRVALSAERSVPAGAAAARIVAEAMRDDTTVPLFYLAGAGLTDLAEAYRLEPRIGRRLKLVWIGGPEHADLAPLFPVQKTIEYNEKIDLLAVREIFNHSDIEIWQVPRDAYRTMLVSFAELDTRLADAGRLGQFLKARLARVIALVDNAPPPYNIGIGETYILGDSPLVTLTALQSSFEADSASSTYVVTPTPQIDENGFYGSSRGGRPMRVYRQIDTRLTFEDMFAKFAANARH